MKTTETQILKGSENGAGMTEMVQRAEYMVGQVEMEAQLAESTEQEMRTKLEQALAAKARAEQANEKAAQTEREIQGAVA